MVMEAITYPQSPDPQSQSLMGRLLIGPPRGNRRQQLVAIETFDDAVAEHGDRNGAPSARDELVVRTVVFVDVAGGEAHTFA